MSKRTKYSHYFDRIVFVNRWAQEDWERSDNYVVFGVYKRQFSTNQYEYQIGVFGLIVRIFMKCKLKPQQP